MGWEFHSAKSRFGLYKYEWDKLNANLCDSNPYFDSCFVGNLLKHFATGKEILCVHRSKDVVDGMLIVRPERAGRWLLFNPAQSQIAPLFVNSAREVKELMAEFPALVLGLGCSCQDPLVSPFPSLSADLVKISTSHVITMGVQIEGVFDDYWKARSPNLRKSIGRRLRRLSDVGHVLRLQHLDDATVMRDAITRFGDLESKGWKGQSGSAVNAGNVQGAFYTDVMADFAGKGCASIYELFFDDNMVAMQLCILSSNMLVLLKTTYDEQYASYSPGRLLLYCLLEREFDLGRVRTVEFYTSADSDQLAWATHQRPISHFLLFRNAAVKAGYSLVGLALRSFKSWLR